MGAMLLQYLFWILVIACQTYVVYHLISLPMRRREKQRLFLDIVETGLRDAQSPVSTVVSLAKIGDRSFGKRLSRLATHLENGMRFTEGLRRTPGLLNPQIVAILEVGEAIGDVGKVVSAARKSLEEGNSQIRVVINYLFVLLIGSPILATVVSLNLRIVPKFREIFRDLIETGSPLWLDFVCNHRILLNGVCQAGLFAVYLGAILYLLGPRSLKVLKPWCDQWSYRLPWRCKRLTRDFSLMLTLLLDAGVPEERAVAFAARSTANEVFIQRAVSIVDELRGGLPLPQAIQRLDDDGEFRWRLANACHWGSGFSQAMKGWHDTLEAKAFREEQAVAQLLSTTLVLLNGFVIAIVVVGLFQPLVEIIERMTLW